MTIYSVSNHETEYYERFTSLTAAKKAMKENNARCFATKIWSSGEWEPMGEIFLKGNNAKIAVGATRQTKANYN